MNLAEYIALSKKVKKLGHLVTLGKLNGVTFIDRDSVYVTDLTDISIGVGTIIYPNTYLLGKISIGNDCIVFPNMVLLNVTMLDRCIVGRPSLMDTEIKQDAKIGSFAEIVRSHIGERSAAQHSCYIGDAFLGDDVNIGSGTCIANYDGEKKNKTIIEDGANTGINAKIIAPIVIGREALIAAGATATKDVPCHAIVKNVNEIDPKKEWAKTKKGWKARNKTEAP